MGGVGGRSGGEEWGWRVRGGVRDEVMDEVRGADTAL